MTTSEREQILKLNEQLCNGAHGSIDDPLVLEQIAETEVLLFNDPDYDWTKVSMTDLERDTMCDLADAGDISGAQRVVGRAFNRGADVTVRFDCPCATWTWAPEMIEQHPDWAEGMLRHHNYCDGNGQNVYRFKLESIMSEQKYNMGAAVRVKESGRHGIVLSSRLMARGDGWLYVVQTDESKFQAGAVSYPICEESEIETV